MVTSRVFSGVALVAALFLAACGSKGGSAPDTEEGAKALLQQFLAPNADHVALSKSLRPQPGDYAKVFASEEDAKKAEKAYEDLWGQIEKQPIKPKEGQTELTLASATTDELKGGAGDSKDFPGGYKEAANKLRPGIKVYRFKFVKPGETSGMAFDGLYNIDGRWVLMPKPWRALK